MDDLDIPEVILGSVDQKLFENNTLNIPFEKLDAGDTLIVSNLNLFLINPIINIIKELRGIVVKNVDLRDNAVIFKL